CRIAAAYLRDELRHLRLVSFETDELLDYRGARPQATFDGTSFAEVDVPELTLSLMYDEQDRPFLFLDGPEPDLQWRRLAEALIDLVEFFDVERVVGMQGVPMAVPHTRPIGLFAHATDPSLLGRPGARATPAPGTVPDPGEEGTPELVIPAAFGTLLEHRLGRAGHPAMGYAAQLPHYLARTDFPAGRRTGAAATGPRGGRPRPPAGRPGGSHRCRRRRPAGLPRAEQRGAPDRQRARGAVRLPGRGRGLLPAGDHDGPPDGRRDRGALRALPRRPRRRLPGGAPVPVSARTGSAGRSVGPLPAQFVTAS